MGSVLLVSPRKMGKIQLNLREGHIFSNFSGGNIGGTISCLNRSIGEIFCTTVLMV